MTTQLTRGTRFSVLLVVVALAAACGGGGSGTGTTPGTLPGTITGLQVFASGGEGWNGDGGAGGDFYIEAYTGGDIKVLNEGVVDTAFVLPVVDPELGSNPRTITVDTTLTPDASYKIVGDDGLTDATGLHVLPGVTLTLRGNKDTDSVPATMERARLDFDNGIVIEGTLTGYADLAVAGDGQSRDAVDIHFRADNLVMTETAVVDLRGKDAPAGRDGGDGGEFYNNMDGTIVSAAHVRTSGGSGDNGGDAGYVEFYVSDYGAHNTGAVEASGGEGLDGIGGDADYIEFHIHYGPLRNSGQLVARGGDGTLGGGDGGYIDFDVCDVGTLINSGDLDSSGGHALVDGAGGDADTIWFGIYTGPSFCTGSYVARGGNGAGSGDGGDGDDIEIDAYDDDIEDAEHGFGVNFAAAMDVRGGNGKNGGDAGDLDFYLSFDDGYNPDASDHQGFLLVGYATVDLSGGAGSAEGGDAGDYELEMEYGDNYDIEYIGSIVTEVSVMAVGGDGASGFGGTGGDLDLTTYDDETFHFDRLIRNTGDFDLRGGDGPLGGGSGGDVWIYEYNRIENLGRMDVSGGAGMSGPGGDSGYIELASDDVVINEADLRADGGASTSGTGGDGDYIDIYGRQTTCVGALSCCGGASTSGAGGAGGDMDIYGAAVETVIHGACIVIGGTGTPTGGDGEVWLDGVNCDLTGGQVLIP